MSQNQFYSIQFEFMKEIRDNIYIYIALGISDFPLTIMKIEGLK